MSSADWRPAHTNRSATSDRLAKLSLTRRSLLTGVAGAWLCSAIGISAWPTPSAPAGSQRVDRRTVRVVHWANGHMMNKALLPHFAEQFNRAGHRTRSGKPIVVEPITMNSGTMLDELIARTGRGSALNAQLPDPTIITPAANHWLTQINYGAGRNVVDPEQSQSLAVTWVGIVTYRDMAECLGWPQKDIGIADVVALASERQGWKAYRCARAEWRERPLMSYTDPYTSSTGRSMLYALYSIAAGKPPEQLTAGDVARTSVVDYVKRFQRAVAHYVYDTLILNSKIYGGPSYGHFFFIVESNLVQLYQGKLAVTVGGDVRPQPLSKEMVFIYPREGATAHNHAATIVQANWVTSEHVESAQRWIAFLREEAQQQSFMAEGFRPATSIPYVPPAGSRFVPDLSKPTVALNPDTMAPATTAAIVDAWEDVKKPGVVTFVVDASGSMKGTKLEEVKKGLTGAIDGMPKRNQAGLVAFSDNIVARVPVAPLAENQFDIKKAIDALRVTGGTALYDGIKAGIEMTDAAVAEEDAIRGVVVATDGRANGGETCLHNLITLMSAAEKPIRQFCGFETETHAIDAEGNQVAKSNIMGTGLALKARYEILVFFIGIGADKANIEKDVDMDIGRMIAEATNSSFRGVPEKDLASVLETFGKYF